MLFPPLPSNLRPSSGTRLSRGRYLADVALFNESQYRIVITFAPHHTSEILDFLKSKSVPNTRLGEVTKDPALAIEATGKNLRLATGKTPHPIRKNHPFADELEEVMSTDYKHEHRVSKF